MRHLMGVPVTRSVTCSGPSVLPHPPPAGPWWPSAGPPAHQARSRLLLLRNKSRGLQASLDPRGHPPEAKQPHDGPPHVPEENSQARGAAPALRLGTKPSSVPLHAHADPRADRARRGSHAQEPTGSTRGKRPPQAGKDTGPEQGGGQQGTPSGAAGDAPSRAGLSGLDG